MTNMRSDNSRLGRLGGIIFMWEAALKRRKRGSVDAKSMIVRGKKGGKKNSEEGGTQMIVKRGLKKNPHQSSRSLHPVIPCLCNYKLKKSSVMCIVPKNPNRKYVGFGIICIMDHIHTRTHACTQATHRPPSI